MKRLLTLFLLLLPALIALAEDKNKVKSIDIVIDMPQAGMTMQQGEKLALKAAKTAFGDLAQKGIVTLQDLTWEGEFDDKNPEYPKFQAGHTYTCHVKLAFKYGGGYVTNYAKRDGDNCVDETLLKATVNGKEATTQLSAPYYPGFLCFLTVPGGDGKPLKRVDGGSYKEYVDEDRNWDLGAYSQAEADRLWVGKQEKDCIIWDHAHKPADGYLDLIDTDGSEFDSQSILYVTKWIINIDNSDMWGNHTVEELANKLVAYLSGPHHIREVWLGEKVDAARFVNQLKTVMKDRLTPLSDWRLFDRMSFMFTTAEATLVVPQAQIKAVAGALSTDKFQPCFTVKTYTGDIYAAQKAGVKAAKDWCTQHQYTAKIAAADRRYHFADCKTIGAFFYSCNRCGKCERNPNHVFYEGGYKQLGYKAGHENYKHLATKEAYVGVNAAGEHVFWISCKDCNHAECWQALNMTQGEWQLTGNDASYSHYKHQGILVMKQRNQEALAATQPLPSFFTLPAIAKGKMSQWAEDGVNRAASDNMIDDNLLGNDYTRTANRLQLASIAVRLAETMTGKEVKDPGRKFSDTDNSYANRAAQMQLFDGICNGNFQADATVSRQEMATVLRRTLTYIENNSKIGYSTYTSRLSRYTDQAQLKDWAKEPMACMEALGVVYPATSTTLAPAAPVSIELALDVAERCTRAHKAGWYQTVASGEKDGFITVAGGHNDRLTIPTDGGATNSSMPLSERFWALLPPPGYGRWLPVIDPYTGQTLFFDGQWAHPIRQHGSSSYAKNRGKVARAKQKAAKAKGGNGLLKKGLGILKGLM